MTLPLLIAVTVPMTSFILADEPPSLAGKPVGGGAVVSPDAATVFGPAKTGGIEAIEIATGKVLWTNTDANQLAGVSSKVVVAWSVDGKKPNSFRMVLIDATTGKTTTKSDPIEMPEWATTVKTWGRVFRIAARVDGDAVIVAWQADAFYAGGARPKREVEAAARKMAAGVASIDLKSGKVSALDRKPIEDEFKLGPGSGIHPKVGDYEFQVTETEPKLRPGVSMVTTVTLTVFKGKTELWTRELAGNPWSPPPP